MATKKAVKPKKTKLTQAALVKIQMAHTDIVDLMTKPVPKAQSTKLGVSKAIVIVLAAANTGPGNLPRTLSQLGINGASFRTAVFSGITHAGHTIDADQIPNAPSTTLLDVVAVVQNV